MNNRPSTPQSSSMSIGDIWYVLFRHKWKILFISAVAIAAAFFLPYYVSYLPGISNMQAFQPDAYESEARLMIKYVMETKSPDQIGDEDPGTSRIAKGDGVINTEMDILTSMDLAKSTAEKVTPERILASLGGGSNIFRAAAEIRRGLVPQLNKYSKVVRVRYRHPDPQIPQLVLTHLISEYRRKHSAVHVANLNGTLIEQISSLQQDLINEENKLTNHGLMTIEAAKIAHSESISKLNQSILDVELQLAERQAAFTNMAMLFPVEAPGVTNTEPELTQAPKPDSSSEYSRLLQRLEKLYDRENTLLMQFNGENTWVKGVQAQIQEEEALRRKMEEENPALLAMGRASSRGGTDPRLNARMTMAAELAAIRALETRRKILGERLAQMNEEAKGFPDDSVLGELQRKRQTLQYLSASLDRSKIDQALASGNVLNIATVQEPSEPLRVPSKMGLMRILIGIAGVGGAIGLAFLLEIFVDQSVRRPVDLQLKVGAPLFITIPRLRINGHSRVLSAPKRPLLVENSDPGAAKSMALAVATKRNGKHPAPWEPGHPLFAFAEALRDRLINWFEVHDLTHSPKLVAVTSCAEGSGVSTIASGLAASLSETGEGNVLLVDMNQRNGSSKQFHKGELAMGIDDALEENTRSHAMVQDKLYVVSENKESGQLAGALPKRFRSLVPKLKASDYDYIIFDMPPVSQISLTPRLAKFMDMVLMVVESEETDKNVVASACGMLTESKANVGIVLNKARNYVPKRLVQRL